VFRSSLAHLTALLGFCILMASQVEAQDFTPAQTEKIEGISLKETLNKKETLPLSLEQAFKLALGQSIQLKIATEKTTTAKLAYHLKLSDLLPDVTAQLTQNRFVGGFLFFGSNVIRFGQTRVEPQILAGYTLYPLGQNIFEMSASKARLEAQKKLEQDEKQALLRDVSLAYTTMQQAYWQKAILKQASQEAQQRHDLSEARLKAGLGVKVDVLMAQSYLNKIALQSIDSDKLAAQAAEKLGHLLNLPMNIDVVPANLDATTQDWFDMNLPIETMMDQALKKHPQLQALQFIQKSAKREYQASFASLAPRIHLNTYLGQTGVNLSNGVGTKSYGFVAQTDLLENMGFARWYHISGAKNTKKLADLTYQEAVRMLQETLSNTQLEIKALQQKIVLLKDNLETSKEAYAQSLGRLKAGVGTPLELENTMSQLTEARGQLAKNFLDLNQAQLLQLANLGQLSIEAIAKRDKGDPQ
jgi:outer membrane protein TolC